jgi:hypothetical protein
MALAPLLPGYKQAWYRVGNWVRIGTERSRVEAVSQTAAFWGEMSVADFEECLSEKELQTFRRNAGLLWRQGSRGEIVLIKTK